MLCLSVIERGSLCVMDIFFGSFCFLFCCIVRGGGAFWWLEFGFGGKRCAAWLVILTYSGSAAFGFTERSRKFREGHENKTKKKEKELGV
jgi:hypothetical protein